MNMQYQETHTPEEKLAAEKLFWLKQSNRGLVDGVLADLGGGSAADTLAAKIVGVLQSRGMPIDASNLRQGVALSNLPDQLRDLQLETQAPNAGLSKKLAAVRDLAANFAARNQLATGTGQNPPDTATSRPPFSEMQKIADNFRPLVRPARPAAGQPITDISAFIENESDGRSKLNLASQDLRTVPKLASQLRKLREADANLIIDMSNSNLSGVSLSGINLRGARLMGSNLAGADLRSVDLHAGLLMGANLKGANLGNARLTANFDRADLSNANLDLANLTNAGMQRVNLSNASMREAQLSTADLEEANLQGANLSSAFMNGAYLQRADLRNATMTSASLFSADLSNARLSGVNLESSNLTKTKFPEADLTGADLRMANMTLADFTNAVLTNAQVRGATTRGIVLDGSVQNGLDWENTVR
jgi:uncharacterized protein YjbI with pentapeptide repeats